MGGINHENFKDYLCSDIVLGVGGSWIASKKLIELQMRKLNVNKKIRLIDFLDIEKYNFDNRKFPVWLDLANSLEGFREGVSELRTGNFTENSNGTISYDSFGVGIFFIPSGIGYFENTSAGIPEYSPLIFSVKLMTYVPTDHDSDGILSILEDIDLTLLSLNYPKKEIKKLNIKLLEKIKN